jgi:CheY-like chemotaxis protein
MRHNEVILNVDDEETPRYIKRRDLEAVSFYVVDAANGAEALRLVERIRPS